MRKEIFARPEVLLPEVLRIISWLWRDWTSCCGALIALSFSGALQEFEIELEGSQTLRILCYEKCYNKMKLTKEDGESTDRIMGKGQIQVRLHLTCSWLLQNMTGFFNPGASQRAFFLPSDCLHTGSFPPDSEKYSEIHKWEVSSLFPLALSPLLTSLPLL